MANQTDRVLIIGGGIGGLTTAIALKQKGINATVFERMSDWTKAQIGGGFDCQINAMRAFEKLGLREKVEDIGTPLDVQEMRTYKGSLLFEWPYREMAQKWGVNDIRLMRPDLHRVLAEVAGEDSVQWGSQFTKVTQDDNGVIAHFSDGREERGAVLIGADGNRSTVRAQLLGQSEPRYAGYVYWRGLIHEPHPKAKQGVCTIFFGPGSLFGVIPLKNKTAWYSTAVCPQGGYDLDTAGLLKRHKGWSAPIADLISDTDNANIWWTNMVDRDPVERWGQGRITLLGDAAHAQTLDMAQGACQAIEDSVVIADVLSRQGITADALRTYESKRIPRTTDVVLRCRQLSRAHASTNRARYFLVSQAIKYGAHRTIQNNYRKDMSYQF